MGVPKPPLVVGHFGEAIVGEILLDSAYICGCASARDPQIAGREVLKRLTISVGHAQSVWRGALDAEEALMHQGVTPHADRGEIAGHRRSTLAAEADVMDVKIDVASARKTTMPIASQDPSTKTVRRRDILAEG
jgi:hypothetical protein